ncbi:SPA1-RELATED 2 protein [Nymphaea thermarum]|nr:SPA1-RELATED 2 protein [Nymphaea thermarum]
MEGMDEGPQSETVKQTTGCPPTKVTDTDNVLQLDRCNALESQAQFASSEHEWPEELSSFRSLVAHNAISFYPGSPVVFGEILEAKRQILDSSKGGSLSHSWSNSGHDCPINNTDLMVEELTFNNYKGRPNVSSADGCSNAAPVEMCEVGQAQGRRVHGQNPYPMVDQGSGSAQSQVTCKEQATVDFSAKMPSAGNHGDSDTDKEKFRNVRLHRTWDQTPVSILRPCQECSIVVGNLESSDRHHQLSAPSTTEVHGGGIRTRVISSSGFSEFFARSTFKGKGIAVRDVEPLKESDAVAKPINFGKGVSDANICSDASEGSVACAGTSSSQTGCGISFGSFEDVVNVREWLQPGSHKLNKSERLIVFKQIVELVNLAHSQGVFIKDLWPSSFVISSQNQVNYVGASSFHMPLGSSGGTSAFMHSSVGGHLKRKRQHMSIPFDNFTGTGMKHDYWSLGGFHSHLIPLSKPQRVSSGLRLSNQHPLSPSTYDLRPEPVADVATNINLSPHSRGKLRVHQSEYEDRNTSKRYIGSDLPNQPQKHFVLNVKQLEEMWYTSPEEINGKACSLSSNIYSLGVLLFELFCCSKSWEMHEASMSDLRHRILPPNFLAENPKEAGFCLWLLHPEPLSRPKARYVLRGSTFFW